MPSIPFNTNFLVNYKFECENCRKLQNGGVFVHTPNIVIYCLACYKELPKKR